MSEQFESDQSVEGLESEGSQGGYFDEGFSADSLPDELQQTYKSMQGDYTRKTQSLAEERKSFESQQRQMNEILQGIQSGDPEVLQMLGYAVDDVEEQHPAYDEDDPVAATAARVEALEAQLQERQQQEAYASQMAEAEAWIDQELGKISKHEGRELTAREQQLLVNHAFALADDQGYPDVQGAYREYQELLQESQQRWINSKRTPAPLVAGVLANKKVDMTNQDERQAYMKAILDAEFAEA